MGEAWEDSSKGFGWSEAAGLWLERGPSQRWTEYDFLENAALGSAEL